MRKLILAAGLAASLGVMSTADVAGADPYYDNGYYDQYHHYHRYHHHYHHHYYYHHYAGGCRYQKHRSGAIGAVAGAVGGGIIGSALTHGGAGGILLGAGAGALTGHALARSTVHC
jgi:hypothetical protein